MENILIIIIGGEFFLVKFTGKFACRKFYKIGKRYVKRLTLCLFAEQIEAPHVKTYEGTSVPMRRLRQEILPEQLT
jgi:hypothetical protein